MPCRATGLPCRPKPFAALKWHGPWLSALGPFALTRSPASDELRQHLWPAGTIGLVSDPHDRLSIYGTAGMVPMSSPPPTPRIGTTHLPTCSPKSRLGRIRQRLLARRLRRRRLRLVPGGQLMGTRHWMKLTGGLAGSAESHPPSKGGPRALSPTQVGFFPLRYRHPYRRGASIQPPLCRRLSNSP